MKLEDYLYEVKMSLVNDKHHRVEEIIAELSQNMEQQVYEQMLQGTKEEDAKKAVVELMPAPEAYAALFCRDERILAPFFISLVNSLLIFSGLLIAFARVELHLPFIESIWSGMVQLKWLLLGFYSALWLLTGYCYGKKNGLIQQQKTIRHTLLALVPNIVLMGIVLLLFQGSWVDQWFTFFAAFDCIC